MKITGVKGMNDILPAEVGRWQEMERVAREVFALYGYREVRTPAVEHWQLFARGVGEATDIVNKEMYVFEDKGEELLALRPEATAGTVRAFIEHGAYVEGPQKWFYMGPMFRRERPQKGRYRQFHQIGCEAFGIAEPFIDAEQIALVQDYFARLGVAAKLKLNTVGDAACRPAYLAELKEYLSGRKAELCADCNDRIERNPLRVLDCKVESCQPALDRAPRLLDRLCEPCRVHFDQVKGALDALGVRYDIDGRLVRGLDYYVRTAYEFTSDALGAQSAVAGGGRYNGLSRELGGPELPAIGFAIGEDRLLEVLPADLGGDQEHKIFLAALGAAAQERAFSLLRELRSRGIPAELDFKGRSLKAQMSLADRLGAAYAVILGDRELLTGQAQVRRLATGEQEQVALENLATELATRFSK